MATAKPIPCSVPHLIEIQPFGQPTDDGVGDVFIGSPFTGAGYIEAWSIAFIDVRNPIPVALFDHRREHRDARFVTESIANRPRIARTEWSALELRAK